MQGLETFPPWAQITLSALGFIVAAFAYARGLFKSPAPSKDVVVPSITVADNAVIAEAASTLREANHHIRERNNLDREMLFHMKLQSDHLEEIKHALMTNPPLRCK